MPKYTAEQKQDRLRILDMTYERHASHLGSALSVVDIVSAIYHAKKPEERFVLSAGHSAVALYAVLEREGLLTHSAADELGVHPDRNPEHHIDVSTGSLGQGLPIALGMAMATPDKNVYCVCTDGELAEGSIWESLRIASDKKVNNLKIVINANGYGAYDPIDTAALRERLVAFGGSVLTVDGHNPNSLSSALERGTFNGPLIILARTNSEQFPFLKGLSAHYVTMSEQDYQNARTTLTN